MTFVSVLDGQVDEARVKELQTSGELSRLIVFLLGPIPVSGWQGQMVQGAGQVYNTAGDLVDVHDPQVRWNAVDGSRWAKPARALISQLKVSPPGAGFGEVVCTGNDPAESAQCSAFVLAEAGKHSSAFWGDFLKDPDPESVIENEANNGYLGRIVVLQLDLLPEKQMLPWQRSFYQKVARTYVITESGGIKALPKPK